MDSEVSAPGPVANWSGRASWPVRSGAVPPLADGFSARPETAPALGAALLPGTAVVLVPGRVAAEGSRDWLGSCGKTQLAVSFAESLWQSREVDLLVWVVATSRASVLSGYVEAAVAAMGTDPSGDAESIAARFVGWLGRDQPAVARGARRPVRPGGSGGALAGRAGGQGPDHDRELRACIRRARLFSKHGALVFPVGVFSSREALSYLMGRLNADPDQRLGAIDLVEDLGCEPLALAQASAVIASSALSCRDYRGYFARRREQIVGARLAAAVTWTFSVEQADRLALGGEHPVPARAGRAS